MPETEFKIKDNDLFNWKHHKKDTDYASRFCRVSKNIILGYDARWWRYCFKLKEAV